MKKIITILFIMLCTFICSSCESNEVNEIYGHSSSCVYYQNYLYFEEIQDNNGYINTSNLSLSKKKIIGETNDFISLNICNNKLYYIKRCDNVQAVLYAIDINNLEKVREIGGLGEYKSIKVGRYNGCEFSVFAVDGNEYVLYNNSIYSIKDNLKVVGKNIVSVYCVSDKLYYSDFNGNVSEYNILTREERVILSRDKLMLGKKIKRFGENVSANDIVVNENYLYYMGGDISYGKGHLYRYNMNGSEEPEYIYGAIDKFYVCNDKKVLCLKDGNLNIIDIDSMSVEYIAEDIIDFYMKDENTIYAMLKKDKNNYNYEVLRVK